MPSTSDPNHAKLELRASEYLKSFGYTVCSLEYHQNECAKDLRFVDTVGAHLIRTRADRVAYNQQHVIRFDAKTCRWGDDSDFAIEAVPFWSACCEAAVFGMPHVFVCQRTRSGQEFGIIAGVDAMQIASRTMIPSRRSNSFESWADVSRACASLFDLNHTISKCKSNGSGDMFVVIDNCYVQQLPHWRDCFDEIICCETSSGVMSTAPHK